MCLRGELGSGPAEMSNSWNWPGLIPASGAAVQVILVTASVISPSSLLIGLSRFVLSACTVQPGSGLVDIFRGLGVDGIVEGGQTMNPSTQDMLTAVDGVPYDEVVKVLGGAGETVREPSELGPAMDRAFASGVPYLVNVITDPADVYPRSSNLA